jgi:glycosyltransferase involved in cell wall biosynthesis
VFSVIVPVHNGEKTLRRCVESLAPQVSRVLLIENGSKDRSRQLCHGLAEEFSNVTALDGDPNGGVSRARNLGLQHADTPYILFCDCDDYVEPDYAESFRLALASADFAICGYINHDEVANGRTDIYGFPENDTVGLLSKLEEIHGKCLLQQLWNKAFSRDVIEHHNIRFDERISIGEDLRFVLDYLAAAKPEKTALIARPLYHYMRDQPGSLMYRMGTEKMEEAIRNLEKLYRLSGLDENTIEEKLTRERERQKGLYAYLIMHNMGMPLLQRRRLILQLDAREGKPLWRKNLVLFAKEKISRLLKR